MSSQVNFYINNTEINLDGNSGLRISKYLSDVREPDKRGAAFTKTLRVPGTKEVNKLFGNIFDIKHSIQGSVTATTNFGPDFNPNLKASAYITVDGVEVIRGYARLLEIVLDGEKIIYEVTIASESKDFFSQLEGKKLSDLDLTDLNHLINRTNISNSWATSYIRSGGSVAFNYGDGYVYPLIDQGGNTTSKNFLIEDLYPALAFREIVSKIFSEAGYTWATGSFFDETIFKHLYLPYPGGGMSLTEADLLAREWKATRITTNQTLTYGATLIFQDESTGSNFDSAAAYNNATGEWTVPTTGTYTVGLDGTMTVDFTLSSGYATPFFSVWKNGTIFTSFTGSTFTMSTSPQDINFSCQSLPLHYEVGDVILIKFYGFLQGGATIADSFVVQMDMKINSYASVEGQPLQHKTGETLDFAGYFDEEKTQRDFLLDIFKSFNLWVTPDPTNDKSLIVKTRNSFYTTTKLDWTNKINVGNEIKITPLGELQDKRYKFINKEGSDIANVSYKTRYGQTYGQYQYTVNNDFVKSTREIKTDFEPTLFINYGPAWDAVLPHIEFEDSKKGAGYRMLYYGGLKTCQVFTIKDSSISGAGSTSYLSYPFFGHVDSPLTPTLDLCFGMPREVSLDLKPSATYTNANLFNVYWRNQIEEITDPNSKIYTAQFWLTPADWQTLTLRELIYVSGELFRINKIVDYDPINEGLTTVELIKSKTTPAFSGTSQRGSRGSDTLDPNGDGYPDIKQKGSTGGIYKPGSGGGDVMGGVGVVMPYTGGFNTGGQGNVALAPDVSFINCTDCIVEPTGIGSTLIDCSSFIVTVPGFYYNNILMYANPMTTLGDIIYGETAGEQVRLGIGSAGQVLTVTAGLPAWETPAGGDTVTVLNPAQLTAWQTTYAPTGIVPNCSIRVDADTSMPFIRSIDATGFGDGDRLTIINDGSYLFGLKNNDIAGTTAANRFAFGDDGEDAIILPKESVQLEYDTTASRWRLINSEVLFSKVNKTGYVSRYENHFIQNMADNYLFRGTSGSGAQHAMYQFNDRFGVVQHDTGTTTTGTAYYCGGDPANWNWMVKLGPLMWFEHCIRFKDLSDATNTYTFEVGFGDSFNLGGAADAILFRYSHGVNSGKWQLTAESGATGGETTADSGITVAADTWYRLRAVYYHDSLVEYFINGVSVGTITSANIPANRDAGWIMIFTKSAGTTNRICYSDYHITGQISNSLG